jgi:polysaccharide export outer membrane protein
MKRITGIVIAALVLWTTSAMGADRPSSDDFRIGPGDVLEIAEWKNPDLTKQVIVLPDGKFSFPLVGEIQAQGKTVAQLKKEISDKLLPYVPAPNLSVVVNQVNSELVYVIGKVNKPGRFLLNSNINVLQALALAGGLNSFAKRDQISVFRDKGGKTEIFTFDYDAVTAGENLGQNVYLMRGDVVVVR